MLTVSTSHPITVSRRIGLQPVDISPTSITDGPVHHPRAVTNAVRRRAFKVQDRRDGFCIRAGGSKGRLLGGERNLFAPTLGPVVVVRRNLQFQRINVPLIHAVIEVDEVGLVLVDQFDIALIPVDQEALPWPRSLRSA